MRPHLVRAPLSSHPRAVTLAFPPQDWDVGEPRQGCGSRVLSSACHTPEPASYPLNFTPFMSSRAHSASPRRAALGVLAQRQRLREPLRGLSLELSASSPTLHPLLKPPVVLATAAPRRPLVTLSGGWGWGPTGSALWIRGARGRGRDRVRWESGGRDRLPPLPGTPAVTASPVLSGPPLGYRVLLGGVTLEELGGKEPEEEVKRGCTFPRLRSAEWPGAGRLRTGAAGAQAPWRAPHTP